MGSKILGLQHLKTVKEVQSSLITLIHMTHNFSFLL